MTSENPVVSTNCGSASSVIGDALRELELVGIRPVVWKNVHRLEQALRAEADLDLLFRVEDREMTLQLLRRLTWVEGQNPRIPRDDRIRHFFRPVQDSNEMAHLHMYFGVLTGESWLKEFDLPVVEMIHADAVEEGGHLVISEDSSSYIFRVRHLLKGGSLFSRMLYSREIDDYRSEFDRLRPAIDEGEMMPSSDPLDIADLLSEIDTSDGLAGPAPLPLSIRARNRMSVHRRFSRLSLPFRRLRAFGLRVLLLRKPKRRIATQGLVVAIVGSDGSGKSSIAERLHDDLRKTFAVERVHLGRPIPVSLSVLKRLSGGSDPRMDNAPAAPDAASRNDTRSAAGLAGLVRALILTAARTLAAQRARRSALSGVIVLADRWPNTVRKGIDGRRLDPDEEQGIRRLAARIEDWLFDRIPDADVCIYLKVPVETAIARNETRDKGVKESADEIRDRHARSMSLEPKAAVIIEYINDGTLETAVQELSASLWDAIAKVAHS